MSAFSIAKRHVDAVLKESSENHIASSDALHALLVALVQVYKAERGITDTRRALEFQTNNLADDLDYEFMRP
jgi:hypothetical protein